MNHYLSNTQMASLVEAIKTAENQSSGEIRIHIDSNTEVHNANTAFEVFKKLCMDKTKERNAVLFHVNFEQKYLTIIGDDGILEKVHQSFWDTLHDYLTSEFAKSNYFKALESAILRTGIELKKHFPIIGENPNELSDEITFS